MIVLNDNHNTFEGVAGALARVLPGMSSSTSGWAMAEQIHNTGQAIVWTGDAGAGRALLGQPARRRPDDGAARAGLGVKVGKLAAAEAFTTLDGSTIRELAGPVSLPTENQSLAEARVPPGGTTDAHYHRTSEEIYYFTGGRGRMRLGEHESDVVAGS